LTFYLGKIARINNASFYSKDTARLKKGKESIALAERLAISPEGILDPVRMRTYDSFHCFLHRRLINVNIEPK